jgi:hypothetical protein
MEAGSPEPIACVMAIFRQLPQFEHHPVKHNRAYEPKEQSAHPLRLYSRTLTAATPTELPAVWIVWVKRNADCDNAQQSHGNAKSVVQRVDYRRHWITCAMAILQQLPSRAGVGREDKVLLRGLTPKLPP